MPVHRLEAPALERKIVNVGFVVKPKEGPHLDGAAELDVSYDGAAPVHVVTNEAGIVATAAEQPAGTGLTGLEAMAHGKSIDKVDDQGRCAAGRLEPEAIDDVFLLLNYEYPS